MVVTTSIDFSPVHHKLIRRPDGRVHPMDEPYYEAKKIAPGTWQILSSGDYHYLLEGDGEAIAIDTGYGAGNLRTYLEQLCSMPVRSVINTHHHFDHTANNCYFDLAYMAIESISLATMPFPSFAGIEFPRDYETAVVNDYDTIQLAGRPLQVFKIPDHAPGSIAILDRRERLLFTGDEFMPGFKRINNKAEIFLQHIEKLMAYRSEFDYLCGGPGILPASEVDIYFEAAQRLCNGEYGEPIDTPDMSPIEPETINGHIVYDCRAPHPEDRNGGKPGSAPRSTHVLTYNGRRFIYNESSI